MNGEKAARTAKATVTHLLLAGIGFVWIYPFIWMISASFKSQSEFFENRLGLIPDSPTIENVIRIWNKADFGTYFINTIIVTFLFRDPRMDNDDDGRICHGTIPVSRT